MRSLGSEAMAVIGGGRVLVEGEATKHEDVGVSSEDNETFINTGNHRD